MILSSWISPKTVQDKPSKISGTGFFAAVPISKGEVLAVKLGHVIDEEHLKLKEHIIKDSEVQISDDLYLAPLSDEEFPLSMIHYNHSCEPNSGIGGNIMVIAMRDIKEGEELTIDYAMHFANRDYRMNCNCNQPICRKVVTGNDWMIPELQKRYKGYFSWYIEQKIKLLKNR